MSQYTNSYTTNAGTVVNTVLDTVSNTQTTTVTARSGQVATSTYPVNGASPILARQLMDSIQAQGGPLDPGIPLGISRTANNTLSQQYNADNGYDENGDPLPAETQAIPVNPTVDPNVAPPGEVSYTPPVDAPPDINQTNSSVLSAITGGQVTQAVVPDNSDPSTIAPPSEASAPLDSPPTIADGSDPGTEAPPGEASYTPPNTNTNSGLGTSELNTQSQATQQDVANANQYADWRVKLSLAKGAQYLYKVPGITNSNILYPLSLTDGVIFPYTPSVSVNYAANYDNSELTHSNYKIFQYRSSAVDNVTIGCDFTAQDNSEANYLLAVIHFFRSVTKMFYGKDQSPKNGTPPPLVYLTGLGAFQFDHHPLAVTAFNYTLPTDVDYIRAGSASAAAGTSGNPQTQASTGISSLQAIRQLASGVPVGGQKAPPSWKNTVIGTTDATYVPTKMTIQITAIPIVTRNDISNNFSLADYATGALLRGSKRPGGGGGIW